MPDKGAIPKNGKTRTAADHLMDIFKKQAKKEDTVTDTQRVEGHLKVTLLGFKAPKKVGRSYIGIGYDPARV